MTAGQERTARSGDQIRRAVASLDEVMREEGIQPHTPLGLWTRTVGQAMSGLATALDASTDEIKKLNAAHEAALGESRQQLEDIHKEMAQGLVQVREMGEVARTSLRKQEEFRKTEIETSLTRIVDGLTATLREEVFLKLREQIPLHERAFFREMRFRTYTRIAMAAFFLSLLGFIGGYSYNWDAARVGSYCKKHEMNDPHDGMEWCALSPPTMTKGGSEEGNASGGDARTQ